MGTGLDSPSYLSILLGPQQFPHLHITEYRLVPPPTLHGELPKLLDRYVLFGHEGGHYWHQCLRKYTFRHEASGLNIFFLSREEVPWPKKIRFNLRASGEVEQKAFGAAVNSYNNQTQRRQ